MAMAAESPAAATPAATSVSRGGGRKKPDLSSRGSSRRRKRTDIVMRGLIYLAFAIAMVPLISVTWTSISLGYRRLDWYFLMHSMRGVVGGMPPYGGIYHALVGTLLVTLGAMVISIPVGIFTAIYLTEYGNKGPLSRAVTFFVDVMTGIPSIVAGLFAYAMFSSILGPGAVFGFVGSVALSVLMIPTVVRSTEEMLKIVPHDLREAAWALGVTKAHTISKVVLPTAMPGIVSGVMLAIARVIGETAPLLVTVGSIDSINFNLFSGRMMTLPVYTYGQWQQGLANCVTAAAKAGGCLPEIRYERSWASALVLILLVLLLNLIGRLVARRYSHAAS